MTPSASVWDPKDVWKKPWGPAFSYVYENVNSSPIGFFFKKPKVCTNPILKFPRIPKPGRTKSEPNNTNRSVDVADSGAVLDADCGNPGTENHNKLKLAAGVWKRLRFIALLQMVDFV